MDIPPKEVGMNIEERRHIQSVQLVVDRINDEKGEVDDHKVRHGRWVYEYNECCKWTVKKKRWAILRNCAA